MRDLEATGKSHRTLAFVVIFSFINVVLIGGGGGGGVGRSSEIFAFLISTNLKNSYVVQDMAVDGI